MLAGNNYRRPLHGGYYRLEAYELQLDEGRKARLHQALRSLAGFKADASMSASFVFVKAFRRRGIGRRPGYVFGISGQVKLEAL